MFADSSVWQNTIARMLLFIHADGQIKAGDCTYPADKPVVKFHVGDNSHKQEFYHWPLCIIDSFMMQ
jgi:hypothetical protein